MGQHVCVALGLLWVVGDNAAIVARRLSVVDSCVVCHTGYCWSGSDFVQRGNEV